MVDIIYSDGLSAWRALCERCGLDLDSRDDGLLAMLKERLDPLAPDLETALAQTSTDMFLSALFASIQPFVAMFRHILAFFERAGARQGQSQWRVSVGDDFLDFRHFEEFLEHWSKIDIKFDLPALDRNHAFFLNSVLREIGGSEYLIEGMGRHSSATTGFPDVDAWIAHYDAGHYAPFPDSIMPDKFPSGISDAATVALAALTILRRQGLNRDEMLNEHRSRGYKSIAEDAFHPWTIAQSETDYWLRSHVGYLANMLRRPDRELNEIAVKLVKRLALFPRRCMPGKIDIKDMERVLSLPVWKQRYEVYGVWIATQIIEALNDHDIEIHSAHGELKFAFSETKIADIVTSMPRLSLFAERRVALDNPVGKGRTKSAQPDFSLWPSDLSQPDCVLVVEVKHYKKRSRRNFRDALIDYSHAHSHASVVLVNYGPVGDEFHDLPSMIGKRCRMIGHLTPEHYAAQSEFRDCIRNIVGNPVPKLPVDPLDDNQIFALDVSGSMEKILASSKLREFLTGPIASRSKLALIDVSVRAVVDSSSLKPWLDANALGNMNSLEIPITELLASYARVIIVTDDDGMQDLKELKPVRVQSPIGDESGIIFLCVTR